MERAGGLAPQFEARAAEAESLRRMPDQTIEDLVGAGLLRVFVPRRYGGFELDYGPAQLALGNVLGRACGSTAWIQSVLACHAWIAGMYAQAAQDAVWGDNPDTIIASAFAPSTGKAKPVDGGWLLDGQWQFSSGVHHAEWIVLMFGVPGPEGLHMYFGLVPRKSFEVLDTWHSPGLRATGSSDVHVQDAFVPREFAINVSLADGRPTPGSDLHQSHIYRLPLWSVFSYNIGCPALGMARRAVDEYLRQTEARPDKDMAQGRHARAAESAADVDAAEALLRADAAEITRLGKSGELIPEETRARWRRNMSYAVMVWTRAVDRLIASVGAHGLQDDSPMQRAFRDIHAVGNHTGLNWDNHVPMWGRVAVGLAASNARGLPVPV